MKTTRHRTQDILKRVFDIIVALIGLIVLAPLFALIAILVRLDSKGPALFKQERIGRDGRPFTIYKFRTMAAGSSEGDYLRQLDLLIHGDPAAGGRKRPYRKISHDPRITRLGRWLRLTYLDELPQLWNVLRGDMSLVGPRPHVRLEVDAYTERQRGRLAVRPGITGLWQLEGKQTATFDEMIEQDLDYIAHWSFWLDLQIIFGTLGQVLSAALSRSTQSAASADGGQQTVKMMEGCSDAVNCARPPFALRSPSGAKLPSRRPSSMDS